MDRPQWITEGMLDWLDQFTTSQAGELFSYWFKTYGDRHNILTEDIKAHKENPNP
jgi:hypothetical protein